MGCLLVSSDYSQIYSIGYNGSARKLSNDSCRADQPSSCGDIHAEANCLIKCTIKDPNKICFVTSSPCEICAKMLINSGISAVYYLDEYRDSTGLDILREALVPIYQLVPARDENNWNYMKVVPKFRNS